MSETRPEGAPLPPEKKTSTTTYLVGLAVVAGIAFGIYVYRKMKRSILRGVSRPIRDSASRFLTVGEVITTTPATLNAVSLRETPPAPVDMWHLIEVKVPGETEEDVKKKGTAVRVVRGDRDKKNTAALSINDAGRLLLRDFGAPVESVGATDRTWEIFRMQTQGDDDGESGGKFTLRSNAFPQFSVGGGDGGPPLVLQFEPLK